MITNNFSKACTETLAVLNNTIEKDYNKIPKEFISELLKNSDNDYNFVLDSTKSIDDLNLLPETIDMLAYIYRKFWCNDDEKKEFDKIVLQNEKIYQENLSEKFDSSTLFNKKNKYQKENIEEIKTNSLTIYKHDNIIKKILNLISNFLKKHN